MNVKKMARASGPGSPGQGLRARASGPGPPGQGPSGWPPDPLAGLPDPLATKIRLKKSDHFVD